jgi:hypothetical protein
MEGFWTARHLAGLLLVLGTALFWAAAFMPIADEKRRSVYMLPPREHLATIRRLAGMWAWANVLFEAGAVVAVLGLALLTTLLSAAGDRGLSVVALAGFAFGSVLWVVFVGFRLGFTPWVARETERTSEIPAIYFPLAQWGWHLFMVYTVLGFTSVGLYGAALLVTGLLAAWIGWLAIGFSALGLVLLAAMRDAPPLLHYFVPLVIGIALLV